MQLAGDNVVSDTSDGINRAAASLPDRGTDVVAQLGAAAEYRAQLPSSRPLRVVVLTDGFATVADLGDPNLTIEQARVLAAEVAVPSLDGVDLTFAGIGRRAGEPPPTAQIDALKAFYAAVCERTGADCLVVTDLAITATGAHQ